MSRSRLPQFGRVDDRLRGVCGQRGGPTSSSCTSAELVGQQDLATGGGVQAGVRWPTQFVAGDRGRLPRIWLTLIA